MIYVSVRAIRFSGLYKWKMVLRKKIRKRALTLLTVTVQGLLLDFYCRGFVPTQY